MIVQKLDHQIKFILLVVVTLTMSTTTQDPYTDESSKGGGDTHQEGCQTDGSCPSKDNSQCTDAPSANSNAVVLYRPTAFHEFREETKSFTFVNKELVIKQKWEDLGVAAVVWDAAVVLAEYLEKNQEHYPLQGKSAIELGAGTGLVSMVAALLGAKVIATDRKLALEFLQENIQANFPCSKRSNADHTGTCDQNDVSLDAMELDWGQNHKDFAPEYDYILGADIVYIEETFKQLLDTLLHLSNSKNTILLSCRIRYDRDVRFLTMMKKYFQVEEVYHDDKRNIKVYVAQLNSFT